MGSEEFANVEESRKFSQKEKLLKTEIEKMNPCRGKTCSSQLSPADFFCFAICNAEYCQTSSKGLCRQ